MEEPDPTPPAVTSPCETLGQVETRSGKLIILDMGLMYLWCGDWPPMLPEGVLPSPEDTARANDAVDLRIEGPDALAAGIKFDRGWHPLYVHDVPRHGLERMQELFAAYVKEHGFSAYLVPLPRRITHCERVKLSLAHGRGAGEIQFHGICAAVFGNVPANHKLPVMGQRMGEGMDHDRWRHVWIECIPGVAIARSAFVGHVAVEEARLMAADPDALGSWKHDEPTDGFADFLFWGKDATRLAEMLKAPEVEPDMAENKAYGWLNLPEKEAWARSEQAARLKSEHKLQLGADFRPHSHHYSVMSQVRQSPTESGSLALGGGTLCGFMTSWGDGLFDVFRDLTADGRTARIRIDVGSAQTVARMAAVRERYFGELSKMAPVSARVARDNRPVRYLYRQTPHNERDSGWMIFAGDAEETDDYVNNTNNIVLLPLRDLIDCDRSLETILKTPAPAAFERRFANAAFQAIEPPPGE